MASMPVLFAQGTVYPDCSTCPSGTYVSDNAPTNWNCYGSGDLCHFSGVSTTSTASTTLPTTSVNNTGGLSNGSLNQSSNATGNVTTVATTLPATTVPSVSNTYPNCNTCPSGTYVSNNAPTYWNCYGTGSLCTYTGSSGSGSTSYSSGMGTYAYGLMAIIAIIAIALLVKMTATPTRLTIIGVALILLGTVAWVLGDYAAGPNYILYGALGVIVGWLVWLYADRGLLNNKEVGNMVKLGVVLSLIGTAIWLYGDYFLGINPTYIWGGVALILIGTIIWLYGDKKVGAFMMRKK
ncbi:MAG TPA: hypothetical protein VNF06_00520 [Candidatus Aquilonibacter sp.]|nr:hypothetical protein [Candidatus Aquilonibacter sp.]